MDKLYKLKDTLCEELEQYGSREKLDVGGLDIVDKLAHAIKNIDKIIEADEGYSGRYDDGMSYTDGMDGRSYARGRSNVRRDSMGRYSSRRYSYGYSRAAEDMADQLRQMMADAPDESTRKDLERLVQKIEQM